MQWWLGCYTPQLGWWGSGFDWLSGPAAADVAAAAVVVVVGVVVGLQVVVKDLRNSNEGKKFLLNRQSLNNERTQYTQLLDKEIQIESRFLMACTTQWLVISLGQWKVMLRRNV